MFDVLTNMPPVGGKPEASAGETGAAARRGTGYDSEPVRQLLRWLGITPIMGERRREHGSGLGGKYRWFVERTIAWLHSFGPATPPVGPRDGTPRRLPPVGLWPYLSKVCGSIHKPHFFPTLLGVASSIAP